MNIEEKYELFEAFVDNSLTENEKLLLAEVLLDANDKKEFEEYCNINKQLQTIQNNEPAEQQFIANLKNIGQQHSAINSTTISHTEPKQFKRKASIIWALGIASMLLLGLFVYNNFNTKQNMQQLYASYMTNENIEFVRGNANDSLQNISTLYDAKQYAQALPLISEYSKHHTGIANIVLVEAVCNIQLNNLAIAEQLLTQLKSSNNNYTEKAEWYLLLVYLKKKDKAAAIQLINTMPSSHFYYSKAMVILKNL